MLFYYPNRPILIAADPDNPMEPKPDNLNRLESQGKYVAEQKWNGDNTLIFTDDWSFWNRRKERLHYRPSEEVLKELKAVFPKGCIINCETVDTKTKTVKDLLVVHCLMAWEGSYLIGKTWGASRAILEGLGLPLTVFGQSAYTNHVLLSRTTSEGFWNLYQMADGPIIEGIILKDAKGKLVFSTTPPPEVSYMLKVRVPSKKYNF